jgi:N-methylhydantoinase A
MIVAVDVGGTFTDVVAFDGSNVRSVKVATTADQSQGVLAGATELADSTDSLLLGTTIATNALLERKGAVVALITDPGFEDVIEIARQDRPSLYDPFIDRPLPLVDRANRVSYPNTRLAGGVEAVAVSMLHSYRDDSAETEIAAAISRDDLHVSLSSEVAPEFREFERTSTTVVNAYLAPLVEHHLKRLEQRARDVGFTDKVMVLRSSGGLMTVGRAARLPAAILLSGPAGGAIAAGALGSLLGLESVIAFDMGGTSTDVCRIEGGRPEVTYERTIDGHVCRMPSAAIHTVGAGGGSIGWVDPGGSLRVGPQSAGAEPGPACYGLGGAKATVTDAHVAMGRIGPRTALGGRLTIDPKASLAALERLAGQIGLDPRSTASGITRVAEEVMTGAVRTVSIEQGADPRRSWLIAFGGAGGLHATALARSLDMPGVLVPSHGGVFSALGLLLSPPRHDLARGVLMTTANAHSLDVIIAGLSDEAGGMLVGSTVVTLCDVRYLGQAHEMTVPYAAGEGWGLLADRFHRLHKERNGFSRPDDPIEIVTVRAEAIGEPPLSLDDLAEWRPAEPMESRQREILTVDGAVEATVFNRAGLGSGDRIAGPAIVEEAHATTYVGPGEEAVVHETGTLEITW